MFAPVSSALKATDAAKADDGKTRPIASGADTSPAQRERRHVDVERCEREGISKSAL
jgi:hypothetical protein